MTCQVLEAVVYNGTDSSFGFVLSADGAVLPELDAVTRATIEINGTLIDSDVVGSSVIWWTDTTTWRGQTVEVLRFRLGGQGLAEGVYSGKVEVFDSADYTNGLRLANPLRVAVE